MQTIVAGNLFVVHFSIECNISELYILRNSWSLAQPIRVFLKIKNMIEFLIASLIDPPPPQKKINKICKLIQIKNRINRKNNERIILHVQYQSITSMFVIWFI